MNYEIGNILKIAGIIIILVSWFLGAKIWLKTRGRATTKGIIPLAICLVAAIAGGIMIEAGDRAKDNNFSKQQVEFFEQNKNYSDFTQEEKIFFKDLKLKIYYVSDEEFEKYKTTFMPMLKEDFRIEQERVYKVVLEGEQLQEKLLEQIASKRKWFYNKCWGM